MDNHNYSILHLLTCLSYATVQFYKNYNIGASVFTIPRPRGHIIRSNAITKHRVNTRNKCLKKEYKINSIYILRRF